MRGKDVKRKARFSNISPEHRVTLGGDKKYDTRDFVSTTTNMTVWPSRLIALPPRSILPQTSTHPRCFCH